MTDRQAMDRLEARLARLARAYTDPAAARRVDASELARLAMSGTVTGRRAAWDRLPQLPWRLDGARAAGLVLVLVILATVALAVGGGFPAIRPDRGPIATSPTPPGGSPLDALRHAWQRPIPITPDLGHVGSGALEITADALQVGPTAAGPVSRSTLSVAGPDTLNVETTSDASGCRAGSAGTYRWTLAGKDTVLTLTPMLADVCAVRQAALSGAWVRADLPAPHPEGSPLPAGTYAGLAFDPFGARAGGGYVTYTVTGGWLRLDDSPASLLLAGPDPALERVLLLLASTRVAADVRPGTVCGPTGDAPGVGTSRAAILAAVLAKPGIVSTAPVSTVVGGHDAVLVDLRLPASAGPGCVDPQGGAGGVVLLHSAGLSGPGVAMPAGGAIRLILVDLGVGRVLAIAIASTGAPGSSFEAAVTAAMPIVDSLVFGAAP